MTHRYRIWPADPAAHLYEVQVDVESPDPAGQAFTFPAWIPGSYMIRDFARNVVAISAESDGVDVPLEKIDKSTWRAAPTDRKLTLTAEIFAYDPSVRGAHLDTTHASFNGACVFPAVVGQENDACTLAVEPPDLPVASKWRVVTSMRRDGAEAYGFGQYKAADYDELIDHPFEIGELTIGEFEADGIPHVIAIRGRVHCDMARLCHDLQRVCEQELAFLGKPADLDRYVFLLHAPGAGYGGLEHRWSSSLVCSRDYLPYRGQTKIDDGYRTFLGLASHEYFHLWNVKRIRPAVFASQELAMETYTRLLWVFEGITSYYDDLALLRSGLITEQSYYELLGRSLTRVRRGAGSTRQSVADSSFDAWIKFYKPDANAKNAIVSYYTKGSLIALCLDLKLRLETEGRVSLDDVMRECWQRYGTNGDGTAAKGLPEDGFEKLCAELSGLSLENFFDSAVRGTGDLPIEALLQKHGVELVTRPAAGAADKGGTKADAGKTQRLSIGADLIDQNGRSVFANIDNGAAAERAGVAPGDVAVALDGLHLNLSNVDQRLRAYRVGDAMDLTVFRGDELLTLAIRPDAAPDDTCYLQHDESASEAARARRAAWLAG